MSVLCEYAIATYFANCRILRIFQQSAHIAYFFRIDWFGLVTSTVCWRILKLWRAARFWHYPHSRAGSMKRYCVPLSVRPSVYLSIAKSSKTAAAGLLLWARRAGDVNRLLQQRRVNAGSATLPAYLGS